MKTIPKNHKKIVNALRDRLTFAVIHTDTNYYRGEPIETVKAWDALYRDSFAKLYLASDEASATVQVTQRCWFKLYADEAAWQASKAGA